MAVRDFVGRGWSFPFRFDPSTGGVSKDRGSGADQQLNRVRMSLQQIIGVKRGEMMLSRRFGSTVRDLIFNLDTFNLQQRLQFAVGRSIQDRRFGEKRVFISRLTIELDRSTAIAEIILDVVLRATNVEGNLVIPFFLAGQERAAVERALAEE